VINPDELPPSAIEPLPEACGKNDAEISVDSHEAPVKEPVKGRAETEPVVGIGTSLFSETPRNYVARD